MNQEMIVPVSSLVVKIKNVLQSTIHLNNIWIQGEVSNLTKHRSGHYYFVVKDDKALINCVMFASNVRRLPFSLEEGMRILMQGDVNVYEAGGQLQLIVKTMKEDGLGNLYLEFEKRKRMLQSLGYFDETHKTKKPEIINNIGIITAKEGAALQDVVRTIRSRWPLMKMKLYPAYVQGKLAPASLVKAIQYADEQGHDALLVVRGGGSFEDLFCFNDVELVKTIYGCKTYIVSGVGHEIDTTLCDLVSDHRSVTPTDAAQWVSLNIYDEHKNVLKRKQVLIDTMQHRMKNAHLALDKIQSHPYIQDPMNYIVDKQLLLDSYMNKLDNAKMDILNSEILIRNNKQLLHQSMISRINTSKHTMESKDLNQALITFYKKQCLQFSKSISLLDAFSPLKTLSRGYSIVSNESIIKSVDDIACNDIVSIRFADGKADAIISNKEKIEWKKN